MFGEFKRELGEQQNVVAPANNDPPPMD